jgi:hypothetical protein
MTGAPFSASIERGSVELVAIGHEPWTNTACWLPNGEISKAPFPNEADHSGVWDPSQALTLSFVIRNESSNAISEPLFRPDKESGISPGNSGMFSPTATLAECYQRFTNPKKAGAMNVTIGVANGTWEFFRALGKGGPTVNKAESSHSETEGAWGAACNTTIVPGGNVAITCDYTKREDWATRMVFVEKNNNITVIPENPSRFSPQQSSGFLWVTSNTFANIREFQLQRRKYQWAEFRNISLQPGHRTTVTAKDVGQ